MDISWPCCALDFAGDWDCGIGTPGEDRAAQSDLTGVEPGEYPFVTIIGDGGRASYSFSVIVPESF